MALIITDECINCDVCERFVPSALATLKHRSVSTFARWIVYRYIRTILKAVSN